MAESSSPDQLCELLATEVLSGLDVAATYLAVLAPDGRITMVGSWGYPADRRNPDDRPSIWYPMAITDTIRTGRVQVYDTWDAYVQKYPHLAHRAAPGKSFVCVPFANQRQRTGGLGLTFATELHGMPDHKDLWPILAQAGDLFVNKSWVGGVFKPNTIEIAQMNADEVENLRESFSDRDLAVIRMTIAGDTAARIARRLDYSESTIKQTRVAVYKKLGVNRAVDLAQAAESLRLFDHEQPAPQN